MASLQNDALVRYSPLIYHDASKHHLDRYAPGPGRMDWATQPDPFRIYAGAPRYELSLTADALGTPFNAIRSGSLPTAAPVDRDTVGTLLELSLGISAWKSYRGTSWALRCNPSSGNLHPTEGYIVCDAVPGLEAGVYHYISRDHVLEQRARPMQGGAILGGVFVGLASIYWREAWKYGIRAFRYCQHDCGHAIAALGYAAAALGWRTRLVSEPGDADIARLLGLDRDADFAGAEREAPDCLLWVGTHEPPLIDALLRLADGAIWRGQANRLSAGHVDWPEIDGVHAETIKPRTSSPSVFKPMVPPPCRAPHRDLSAATILRERRSAVDFDGVTTIGAEVLYGMLEPLVPRHAIVPWDGWPHAPSVHLVLFVHRVDGVVPGLYLFARDPDAVNHLKLAMRPEWVWRKSGPPDLALYLLMDDDMRTIARTVACHQAIAADGCFAVAMLADLGVVPHEAWRYRTLHWECGMIGQSLYLGAEAAGIRATGIGCFFDDATHRLLGLRDAASAPRWQTLYHFTVGGAVEDDRLTTLPPYNFTRSPYRAPAS